MTGAGLPALRAALAEYLARTRGVVAAPGGDNIVICSGFAHGLEVVGRALRAAGAGTLAWRSTAIRGTATSSPGRG